MGKKPPTVEVPTPSRALPDASLARHPEVPGPSTRVTTHPINADIDLPPLKQPGLADDTAVPAIPGLRITDVPVQRVSTAGESTLAIKRTAVTALLSPQLHKYEVQRKIYPELTDPDEQGLIRAKPEIYVDVEGNGMIKVRVDTEGNTWLAPYVTKHTPSGRLEKPRSGTHSWTRISSASGYVPRLLDRHYLKPELHAQLSPYDDKGYRTLQRDSSLYANVYGVAIVPIARDALGEYRAKTANELTPSGPILELIQGTRTWREKPINAESEAKQPRLGVNINQTPEPYPAADFALLPADTHQLSAHNLVALRTLARQHFVDVQGKGPVAVRWPDQPGECQAWAFGSETPSGPLLARIPGTTDWRLTTDQAAEHSMTAYQPCDVLATLLQAPDSNGVRFMQMSTFADVVNQGTVNVRRIYGRFYANDLKSGALGPELRRIPDTPLWREVSLDNVPATNVVSAHFSMSRMLLPASRVEPLAPPDAQGIRTLDGLEFVTLEGSGTVQVRRDCPTELRATDNTGTWAGPLLEQVPGTLTWRQKRSAPAHEPELSGT